MRELVSILIFSLASCFSILHAQDIGSRLYNIVYNETGYKLFYNASNHEVNVIAGGTCKALQFCRSIIDVDVTDMSISNITKFDSLHAGAGEGAELSDNFGFLLTRKSINRDSGTFLVEISKEGMSWEVKDTFFTEIENELLLSRAVRNLSNGNIFLAHLRGAFAPRD